MTQPFFGRTAGTQNAADWGQKYGVDFIDLHFRDDEASLVAAMDELDATGVKYIPCSKNQRTNSFKSGNDTIASDANNYLPANITIGE